MNMFLYNVAKWVYVNYKEKVQELTLLDPLRKSSLKYHDRQYQSINSSTLCSCNGFK